MVAGGNPERLPNDMSLLLDLIYILLGIVASPYILLRMATSPRWRAGFRQRLGGVPARAGDKPCLWIHAASVGEVGAARPLVDLVKSECPEWDIRISTTTNTGQKVARERYGAEPCFYFPLDLSLAVRRAFRRVRPSVVVLMELELWPNFIRAARTMGTPVVVVNGRMREKWVKVYRAMRFLFRPILAPEAGGIFCVQSETYRDRFERLGIAAAMIRVTGNMKYDAVRAQVDAPRLDRLRAALGLAPADRVWVGGCTWPGEEALCLRMHRLLQREVRELRLIIAPRHIERAAAVAREITAAGYECRRRSAGGGRSGPGMVGLLDTVGELGYLYALAEFVFVGKSLAGRGGHNMLEPAALGVMPVFGPFTDNFQDEAQLLLDAGAAERVADEEQLGKALLRLLRDPAARQQRAERGRKAVLERRGASRRHLEILRQVIANRRCP